ncbi:hypothetical protein [Streptomyces halobius]|uniref:Uncharacterized protein n=1 Tax=Streptomyces halobius TaxID=2879846 RepID=A0ABY4M2S3_9ACTN|nr:hypothetical protein [Streptomyces halobius]UQA92074.1 hypothetical protein K9S39_09640 [Streptomyces halobius]
MDGTLLDDGMVYIAEKGTHIVRDGIELGADPLDSAVTPRIVKSARQ